MGDRSPPLVLSGQPLSTGDVLQVARGGREVTLDPGVIKLLDEMREALARTAQQGDPHYGVNTGFGALGRVRVDDQSLAELQLNLVRSHSTGVGEPLSIEVVRGTMFVLAASLSRGHSGIRSTVVETILQFLNLHITPVVPELGSVGASGDLAPLAHIALALIGEGEVAFEGAVSSAETVLQQHGVRPLTLEAKEGLALINGTHLMTARAAMFLEDFDCLFSAALTAAAMSIDSCRATTATLDPRVHRARGQVGQLLVAERLSNLLAESQIVSSHSTDDPRVQDPYSFRCCPAVLGAVWDASRYVRDCVERELGAVTDNPLVFEADLPKERHFVDIVSGGNFHGMPIAVPLDSIAIALSHLAGVAERRVFHMLSGADPEAELPTFLTPQAGLQSGLMIAQYAAAACCNELIGLSNPASVANLTTSAGMEDYNSFGPRAAAKAARGLELAKSVVAIELLCAATGIDHHRPLRSGMLIENAYDTIREQIPPLVADRAPAPDIRRIETMIDDRLFWMGMQDSNESNH